MGQIQSSINQMLALGAAASKFTRDSYVQKVNDSWNEQLNYKANIDKLIQGAQETIEPEQLEESKYYSKLLNAKNESIANMNKYGSKHQRVLGDKYGNYLTQNKLDEMQKNAEYTKNSNEVWAGAGEYLEQSRLGRATQNASKNIQEKNNEISNVNNIKSNYTNKEAFEQIKANRSKYVVSAMTLSGPFNPKDPARNTTISQALKAMDEQLEKDKENK